MKTIEINVEKLITTPIDVKSIIIGKNKLKKHLIKELTKVVMATK